MSPLAAAIARIDRTTTWSLVDTKPFAFDAHHPQGLARVDDAWFLSTVELLEAPRALPGGGRTTGRGRGWVVRLDDRGRETGRVRVDDGDRYHPGGLDVAGGRVIVPVAEYRPDSASHVVAIDPDTLAVVELLRVADHVGAVVGAAHLATWGSRRWLHVLDGEIARTTANPTHAIDFQDCQDLGDGLALCGGVVEVDVHGDGRRVEIGGLALVEAATGAILHEVPVVARSPAGHVLTRNPIHAQLFEGRVRLTCAPDDTHGALLVYDGIRPPRP